VHAKGQVRYVVSDATEPEALLEQLLDEMKRLVDTKAAEIRGTRSHPGVTRRQVLCAAVVATGTLTAWLAARSAASRQMALAVKEDW
jgi:hypothetical protein